ncbi:MAG TPA: translocation/assembly module TamB domain-containing protein, partial [Polyangiaceae bacterium]
ADEGLLLSGTNGRFGLRGAVTLRPRGKIFLRRSEFEVTQGRVRFDDLTRIAPEVDVTAVTEYRRYQTNTAASTGPTTAAPAGTSGSTAPTSQGGRWRIQLHAHGDADNLKVDLTSDPALAQDDIFLLLTVGLTRAELDQAQSASVGESVALEALGSLSGADRAVTDAVPLIDEFRFGSAYSSVTGRTEPTVTIGKRLTRRIRANVTSGIADSREVSSNVEWQLSPRVSVEGSYDNVNDISSSALGNLGADVRWRLEFQ